MDIREINQAIIDLESSEFSLSNARNLASLYIIYNNVEKTNTELFDASDSSLQQQILKEVNDILPAYQYYQEIKRRYQLNEISDDALAPAIRLLMQEIKEFISVLYNNTYLRKERACIENTITDLYNQFNI